MKKVISLIILSIINILFSYSYGSNKDDIQVCKQYEVRSEFKRLKDCLYPYAKNGNAKAQLILGTLYSDGLGTKKDLSKAQNWYYHAANQNIPEAQYLLGLTYSEKNEFTKSKFWLLKAAKQNYAPAQNQLGVMNLYPYKMKEVKSSPNYKEALYWFKRAALLNNTDAYYWLGVMYYQGLGVDKNHTLALKYLKKAEQKGNQKAITALETLKNSSYNKP
ncbi:tetratricopeptide repeat protein [Neisseria zalophi]|uniref:Sel1 repeat family protein n=1 Tax=Neisseria zalophi TaxID=640030 RepID=A0A5J6PWS7_9NEIS|nr:tetratricopeptide repeat protein [Neisseria zalophi]QEY25297.1 sel1 repeat family protein [Neisseria zalophi]